LALPSNGLVGWWPFNGNANDESGNGNNGTVNGATLTTDRFGNVGKAYSFDGVNDYIQILNTLLNGGYQSYSFSYWYKKNSPPLIDEMVINDRVSNTSGFKYASNFVNPFSGAQACIASQNISSQSSCVNLNTPASSQSNGNWRNITFTLDAFTNISKIYLDGILEGSIIFNPSNWPNNTSSTYLGASPLAISDQQWFNGQLDDIGFWNRALTQQEITDLYNGNICYQNITVTDTLLINTGITGFNPITYENTLRVWPNPTNDHITIDAGNLNVMNGYSIRITNSLGQQMFQSAINQQQFYLDLSTWTGNGMYFLNLIDPSGNIIDIKKIVLQ
jgi:hypothetical protein